MEENVLAIPSSLRNNLISLDTKHLALSLCTMAGKPNKLNNGFKLEITVRELTSLHENTTETLKIHQQQLKGNDF